MSMDVGQQGGRLAGVRFTGARGELFGLLFRSYLLMVPTIGIYRFWLVTAKRRFYWQNTEIDGDALEYTGNARQLLIGFLFALVVFLPLYGLFFYLSIQDPVVTGLGYLGIGVLIWFLMGYATYRARDFRLSRTLWRGIRFDQKGSAWGYAFRRFGWSILMIATLGLVYPFMAGNLWRYRYANTWYGDRQFSFDGSWKLVAGPFYAVYGVVAVPIALMVWYTIVSGDYIAIPGGGVSPGPLVIVGILLVVLFGWLGMYFYQGREVSRMFSAVRCGTARANVQVRGRALLGQFLLYGLAMTGTLIVFGIIGSIATAVIFGSTGMANADDAERFVALLRGGFWPIAALIGGYLLVIASFALLAEVILGFGFWKLVAMRATISDVDSLRSVKAGAEDPSLAGEGLADALNVGAY